MPQPISTPTAAGTIAPSMNTTLPTVAPMPTCASGMSARGSRTKGSLAVRSACSSVAASMPAAPQMTT